MPKLTQKEKLQKAFIFAQSIKSSARELDYYCKDDGYASGQKVAKEITDKCEEFLQIIK